MGQPMPMRMSGIFHRNSFKSTLRLFVLVARLINNVQHRLCTSEIAFKNAFECRETGRTGACSLVTTLVRRT